MTNQQQQCMTYSAMNQEPLYLMKTEMSDLDENARRLLEEQNALRKKEVREAKEAADAERTARRDAEEQLKLEQLERRRQAEEAERERHKKEMELLELLAAEMEKLRLANEQRAAAVEKVKLENEKRAAEAEKQRLEEEKKRLRKHHHSLEQRLERDFHRELNDAKKFLSYRDLLRGHSRADFYSTTDRPQPYATSHDSIAVANWGTSLKAAEREQTEAMACREADVALLHHIGTWPDPSEEGAFLGDHGTLLLAGLPREDVPSLQWHGWDAISARAGVGATALTNMASAMPSLQRLSITSSFGDRLLMATAEGIAAALQMHDVAALELTVEDAEDGACATLFGSVGSWLERPSATALEWGVALPSAGQELMRAVATNRTLRQLTVTAWYGSEHLMALLEALQEHPCLEELRIDYGGCQPQQDEALIIRLAHLHSLMCCHLYGLDNFSAKPWCLEVEDLPVLQELHLDSCEGVELPISLAALPSLQEVEVHGNPPASLPAELWDDGWRAVCAHMRKSAPSLSQMAHKAACDIVKHLLGGYATPMDWTDASLQFSLAIQVQERLQRQGLDFYVPRFTLEDGMPVPVTEPLGCLARKPPRGEHLRKVLTCGAVAAHEIVHAFYEWLFATAKDDSFLLTFLEGVGLQQRLLDAKGLSLMPGFLELSRQFFTRAAGFDIGATQTLSGSGKSLSPGGSNSNPQGRKDHWRDQDHDDDHERDAPFDNGGGGHSMGQEGIQFKTYAILVGVQKITDGAQLEAPYRDVASIARVLKNMFGEGIIIRTLTDEDHPQDGQDVPQVDRVVTRKDIVEALLVIEEWFKDNRNGQFLFYFSGHATSVADNLYGVMLPSNVPAYFARLDRVGMEEIYRTFTILQRERSRHGLGDVTLREIPVASIFDCCESGVVENTVPIGIAPTPQPGQACITMMCACAANRGAFEIAGANTEDLGLFTREVVFELDRDGKARWAPMVAAQIELRQNERLLEEPNAFSLMQHGTYPRARRFAETPCFMFSNNAAQYVLS